MGLERAVLSLTRPAGAATLTGAAPTDDDGPLAPEDAWGHDHLWFLDRMVRTNQPLIERMTLIWHDWFATSNDGGRAAAHARPERAVPPPRARLVPTSWSLDVTADPAMILWLNQNQNTRWHPNENYARELMELFTLGADRGAYTEDDVRELARALTGWRSDWSAELGEHNFRFDADRHDPGPKTVFGRTGSLDWQDACACACENPKHPSFFVQKLWSYFIPLPPVGRPSAPRSEQAYVQGGYAVRPVVEAILMHPQLHRRPADGQAAGGLPRRDAAPPAPRRSTRPRGAGSPTAWASGCSARPTCPAGTTTAGSTRARCAARWETRCEVMQGRYLTGDASWTRTTRRRRRRRRCAARSPSGATRRSPPDGRAALTSFAATCLPAVDGQLAAALLPRHPPERPAAADRHVPRPTDELMTPQRTNPAPPELRLRGALPRQAAAPGRLRGGARRAGCRPSSPACRRPRAPASRGARSCRARAGWRWPSTARSALGWEAFEEGIAAAAERAGGAGARVGVPRGRRGLAEHARPDRPLRATRSCGRTWRSAPARAPRSPRTRACAGTPRRPRWPPCTARARSPSSRRSATPAPTSRTSPAATSGRSARPTRSRVWAGWAATSTARRARQPAPGAVAGLGPLARAGRRQRARGRDVAARRLRLLVARRLGPGARGDARRDRRASAPAGTTDPGLAQARGAAAATGRLRTQLAPFQSGYSTPAGVTYPDRLGLPPPPGGARRDAGRRAAAAVRGDRGGGRLRHPLRPGRPACPEDLQITCDSLLAFQRDLEARGLADRVLVHVWSEFGRRPEENGSGTDHGAGGCSFLIGTQARGEMVGEFPGLTALDEDDNLRSTSDFRGVYRGLLEQWFGVDAAPIIPNASSSPRRRCSSPNAEAPARPAAHGCCAQAAVVGHGPAARGLP